LFTKAPNYQDESGEMNRLKLKTKTRQMWKRIKELKCKRYLCCEANNNDENRDKIEKKQISQESAQPVD
jgi:hypothetical protein